jgi:hypothetical protein
MNEKMYGLRLKGIVFYFWQKMELQIGWDVIYLERESCIDKNKWEEDNVFGHGYLWYIMFGLFASDCYCSQWLLIVNLMHHPKNI